MDFKNQNERVVLLGASGWVGQTASRILKSRNCDVMLVASSEKSMIIDDQLAWFKPFNFNAIEEFEPTLVVDSAFITRERLSDFQVSDYVHANEILIQQALWSQSLPSVEMFIGISSGAALPFLGDGPSDPKDDIYGWLKATYESQLLENERLRDKTKVARVWSVSGDLVTKPSIFAFSNLIQQALSGSIKISSAHEVWRRYVDVEDVLKVVLSAEPDSSRVIESGGDLVEIGQLAELVFEVIGAPASIERSSSQTREEDCYFSNNLSWENAINQIGYKPKTIREQIAHVARSFAS